tara:strand:- start:19 stop:372 length:354 start_codon:yes stop_codon:yes gene_type:complete
MRPETTLHQDLVNKINAKQGFSHSLIENPKRYIVGYKTVLQASNPSMKPGVYRIVERALTDAPKGSQVFGGWMAKDGTYYVDYSTTHDGLTVALDLAFIRGELAIWDSLECKEIKVK